MIVTFFLYYLLFALTTGLMTGIVTIRNNALRESFGISKAIWISFGCMLGATMIAPIIFFILVSGKYARDFETELLPTLIERVEKGERK